MLSSQQGTIQNDMLPTKRRLTLFKAIVQLGPDFKLLEIDVVFVFSHVLPPLTAASHEDGLHVCKAQKRQKKHV
jgi:hypothetical protein